jgi:hypothetical protein
MCSGDDATYFGVVVRLKAVVDVHVDRRPELANAAWLAGVVTAAELHGPGDKRHGTLATNVCSDVA